MYSFTVTIVYKYILIGQSQLLSLIQAGSVTSQPLTRKIAFQLLCAPFPDSPISSFLVSHFLFPRSWFYQYPMRNAKLKHGANNTSTIKSTISPFFTALSAIDIHILSHCWSLIGLLRTGISLLLPLWCLPPHAAIIVQCNLLTFFIVLIAISNS